MNIYSILSILKIYKKLDVECHSENLSSGNNCQKMLQEYSNFFG